MNKNKYGVYNLVFGIDDYIKSDLPLFVGTREECIKWVKQNQYNEHGDIIYDKLTIERIGL